MLTRARRLLLPLALAGAATSPLLRAFALFWAHDAFAFVLPMLHLDSLGLGIVAALVLDRGDVRGARLLGASGIAAGVLLLAFEVLGPSRAADAVRPTLVSIVAAAIARAAAEAPQGTLARALGVWPLRALGRVSYGFYVFHLFVLVWLWRLHAPWLPPFASVRAAIALVVTTAIAALSWHAFERPILTAARRALDRRSPG